MDAESVYRNFTLPGTPTRGVIGSDLEADVTLHPTHLIHKVTGSAKINTIELPYEGFAGFVILAFEGGASISTEGNVNAAFTAEPGSVAMLLWLPGATSWFGGTLAGAAETPVTTKAREDRLEKERLRKERRRRKRERRGRKGEAQGARQPDSWEVRSSFHQRLCLHRGIDREEGGECLSHSSPNFMEDITVLNKRLKERYGRLLDGRGRFRLAWSDDQQEYRFGLFRNFYGHIIIREAEKVRLVKKYDYINPPCWVLEKLVFYRARNSPPRSTVHMNQYGRSKIRIRIRSNLTGKSSNSSCGTCSIQLKGRILISKRKWRRQIKKKSPNSST